MREHDALYDAVYCDRRGIVDSSYSYDQRRDTLRKRKKKKKQDEKINSNFSREYYLRVGKVGRSRSTNLSLSFIFLDIVRRV